MTNTKVCPKCAKRKSLDDFKPRPDGAAGSYCYPCEIVYYREYNAKRYATPEARAEELRRTRERYHRLFKPARIARKKRLIALAGGRCVRCGYARSAAALDFHHREPTEKTRTVSHLLAVNQPWAWDLAVAEAAKCDLVCSNCHREETFPGWDMDPEGPTTPTP